MKEPTVVAVLAITDEMTMGSLKDGQQDKWRERSVEYHLSRAIRHATTAWMIRAGLQKDDGENHAQKALTRLAMALCK